MSKPIYTAAFQTTTGSSSASSPLRDLNSVILSSSDAINLYNNQYPTADSTNKPILRTDLRVLLRTQAAIAYQSGQLYQ
jgi:hypothetical protein